MIKKHYIRLFIAILTLSFRLDFASAQTVPPLFADELVSNGWTDVEGFEFDANGRMYVWEKAGKVWIVDTNGVKQPTPLIDISPEVGNWRDHGLNGFALDPDFLTNGYYYLYYTVDRHHLVFFGTFFYSNTFNDYYKSTIVRVTRYQANAATNFTTTVANSRTILVGESASTGIPCLHESHTGGALVFGTDGSLIISTGDGASYASVDSGSASETYYSQAINTGIITSSQNRGAFRSQMVSSYNGKLLRIDPMTGNGLPSNPYYNALSPRSAQSRSWALGLRNPFRITKQPNTGSTDITAGNPGNIFIGDVQWYLWEELSICDKAGENFGWPLFEGSESMYRYNDSATVQNLEAPNPLFGQPGCTKQNFMFKDLCVQPNNNGSYAFMNPCNAADSIPNTIPTFYHKRPVIDWHHASDSNRIAAFDSAGNAVSILLSDTINSPVAGNSFKGNCSAAGSWYTGYDFPVEYQNTYFHLDFGGQWIKNFVFDSLNNLKEVKDFAGNLGAVVFLTESKKNGALYYVKFPDEIRRIRYTANVDNPPVAIATADTIYGASPLTVQLDASQSYDIEGSALKYFWDFGDGNTDSTMSPVHIFTDTTNTPHTFTVTLTVFDAAGHSGSTALKIYLNNTPPVVNIISVPDSMLYSVDLQTLLPLDALVTDAEHDSTQLTYAWQTIFHHNNHSHPDPVDNAVSTYTIISPTPCDEVFYYALHLTVTDANGLSGNDVVYIYPACNAPQAAFNSSNNICPGNSIQFTDSSTNVPTTYQWYFEGGNPQLSGLKNPLVTYDSTGVYDVQLIVSSSRGIDTLLLNDYVNILPEPLIDFGGDTVYCGGVLLDAGNSGATYLWNDGSTSQTYEVTSSGYYSVNITGSNGCESNDGIAIAVLDIPVVSLGNDTASCGQPVVINVSQQFVDYLWNEGSTTSGITVNQSGDYFVLVTDTNSCKNSDTISVFINLNPVVNLGIDTATCSQPVTLLTDTGLVSYLWNDGSTSNSITVNNTGLYAVTVTDENGCTATDEINVTVNALPFIELGTDTSTCNIPVTLNADSIFVSYLWSDGSTTSHTVANTTGIYSITITDSNGCTSSDSISVVVNPLPVISLPADTASCNVPITIDAGNDGIVYLWSNGETTQTITVNSSSTYTVTVANAGGCSNQDLISVSINPLPQVNIGNDTATCAQPVLLDAGSAVTYLWNNGDTSQTLLVNTSGIYAVVISDANGCSNTDSASVEINALPNVQLNAFGFDTLCVSTGVVPINSGLPSGGVYSGNGVTGNLFDPNVTGTGWQDIYYSVTDSNNCSNIAHDSVYVDLCLGINETTLNNSISIYPNPAGDFITIEINKNFTGKIEADIFDALLNKVKHIEMNNLKTNVTIADWAAGLYIVKFVLNDKTGPVQTFIKSEK